MCISVSVFSLAAVLLQGGGATLLGVVRDARSEEPVSGAVVVLSDLHRATTTSVAGRYRLPAVPAGLQHLEVRRIGYATRTLHAFVPAAGRMEIQIKLQPDPVVLPGLEVYPPVAIRGTDTEDASADPSTTVLTAAALRNHPLLAEPDVFHALSGGVVATHPEAARGLYVRGGGADQLSFLLDGIPVFNPYHSVGLFSAWDPDVLARVRVDPNPGPAAPDVLSGVVAAETLRPGSRFRARGALSSSQFRASVDGPLPLMDGGYLLSGRHGFPGFPTPDDEFSYVRGRSADWLATVKGSAVGGEVRLLGYVNRNRTQAAAVVPPENLPEDAVATNAFVWSGSSWGAEWSRAFGSRQVQLRAWRAVGDASARWVVGDSLPVRLTSAREDLGTVAVLQWGTTGRSTVISARVGRTHTRYRVAPVPVQGRKAFALRTTAVVAGASVQHARALSAEIELDAGLRAALYMGRPRLAPNVAIRWVPRANMRVSVTLGRTYQAEQSLANPESVIGLVFPPALFVGAGAGGVPVARSDQVIVAAEVELRPGLRVATEMYGRGFAGLALVAPVTAQPFAFDVPVPGTGEAAGGALEISLARARYALLTSYGYERLRYSTGGDSYVPSIAAAHRLDAGFLLLPRARTSVRVGLSAALGRRGTSVRGPFEWEACNVVDLGCEFAGSPQNWAGELGHLRLPAYVRLDLGVRQHWHLRLGSADAELGAYATLSNVLNRRNALTLATDPLTGAEEWIEMRSRVPLVVGLDWRF